MKDVKKVIEKEIAEQEAMSPEATRGEFVRGRLHGMRRILYLVDQDAAKNAPDEKFETFWKAYPRRIAKKNALKVWTRLKVDDELFARIMAALEVAKKTRQWQDVQYVPHPTTWLNGERWNDEVKVAGTPPSNEKYSGI